jgi:signal transduction histidine kinase
VQGRGMRVVMAAHLLWLGVVCLLTAWWTRVMLTQAARIAELEAAVGVALEPSRQQWARTQRMLYWESGTFFALLLSTSALVFWLYRRDLLRMRGVHAFFASVTHELRTPLTSIRLQAESIAESSGEGVSQKHLVDRLLEDTVRLEGQVERTLELARLEGGGPVFTQPVPFKSWLERQLRNSATAYGQRFRFDSKIDDVQIDADPAALEVIFRNILENSLRHARKDSVGISIRTETGGERTTVRVADDGPGYSGDLRVLGQLFQKGVGSPGAGVGLYLVRALMERMGGKAEFGTPMATPGFEVRLTFREAAHV